MIWGDEDRINAVVGAAVDVGGNRIRYGRTSSFVEHECGDCLREEIAAPCVIVGAGSGNQC